MASKLKTKAKSHQADPVRAAAARRASILVERRETRFCCAPLPSLSEDLGECGRPISYGEQHRYLPGTVGVPLLSVCMPCSYRLQGVRLPRRRIGLMPARR